MMMRFPHIGGFQQCQLFDTFSSHSAMNEIQMKPIAYWNKVSIIGGRSVKKRRKKKAASGEFRGDLTSPEAGGLEAEHNNGEVIVSADYATICRGQHGPYMMEGEDVEVSNGVRHLSGKKSCAWWENKNSDYYMSFFFSR